MNCVFFFSIDRKCTHWCRWKKKKKKVIKKRGTSGFWGRDRFARASVKLFFFQSLSFLRSVFYSLPLSLSLSLSLSFLFISKLLSFLSFPKVFLQSHIEDQMGRVFKERSQCRQSDYQKRWILFRFKFLLFSALFYYLQLDLLVGQNPASQMD